MLMGFGDGATADLFQVRLDGQALRAAAIGAGAGETCLPSCPGQPIALLAPFPPPLTASRAQRAATEPALAHRYATDCPCHERLRHLPQATWSPSRREPAATSATQLTARTAPSASPRCAPPSASARPVLESPASPESALRLGAEGGVLPGVVAEAMTLRRQRRHRGLRGFARAEHGPHHLDGRDEGRRPPTDPPGRAHRPVHPRTAALCDRGQIRRRRRAVPSKPVRCTSPIYGANRAMNRTRARSCLSELYVL
jgi:hypothetical protein